MNRTGASILFLLLLLSVDGMSAQVPDDGRKSVAIVDFSTPGLMPPSFVDLLFVAFSQESGIDMVEREKLAALTREQVLTLSSSTVDGMAAVTGLGELCKADAFVLLEATRQPRSKGKSVRVRVVETRYGIKVLDTRVALTRIDDENVDMFRELCQRIKSNLRRIPKNSKELLLVGVMAFRSEEVSKRWDWLATTISGVLEATLGRQHGVFLLEREKTRMLSEERNLSSTLPRALLTTSILVDGSFRIDRERGADALSVRFQYRKGDGQVVHGKVEGRIDQLGDLCGGIVSEILRVAGQNKELISLSPMVEALTLAAEANRCRLLGDYDLALGPAEAALALLPRQPELEILLLRIIRGYITQTGAANGRYSMANVQLLVWQERAVMIAERLMRDPDVLHDVKADRKLARFIVPQTRAPTGLFRNAFGAASSLLSEWPNPSAAEMEKMVSSSLAEDVVRLRQLKLQMYDCLAKAAESRKDNQSRLSLLRLCVHRSQIWFADPSDHVKMRNDALRETAALMGTSKSADATARHIFTNVNTRGCRLWCVTKEQRIAAVRVGLRDLSEEQNPWLRAHAEASLIQLATDEGDLAQVRHHSKRLTDIIWNDIDANADDEQPEIRWSIANLLYPLVLSATSAGEEPEHDAFLQRQRMEIGNHIVSVNNPMRIFGWKGLLKIAVGQHERSGRPELSFDLLTRALAVLEQRSLQTSLSASDKRRLRSFAEKLEVKKRRLVESYGLAAPQPKSESFAGEVLATAREMKEVFPPKKYNPRFRRIVVTPDCVALVCSVGWYHQAQTWGVVRLSPETWKPLSHQFCTKELPAPRVHDYVRGEHERWGPSVVAAGSTIYLGTPWHGLRIFAPGQPVRALTEEQGLATNAIRHLDILGDVLYAFTGGNYADYTGVMTLDSTSGISRMLWSSREKTRDSVLSGLPLKGVAVDPGRKQLWVLAGPNPNDRNRHQLYHCALATGKIDVHSFKTLEKMRKRTFGDFLPLVQRTGDWVLFRWFQPYLLHLPSNTLVELVSSKTGAASPEGLRFTRSDVREARIVPAGKGVVLVSATEVLYYRAGVKEPVSLLTCVYPDGKRKRTFHDVVPSDAGLFILADDRLALVPGITGVPLPTDLTGGARTPSKRSSE
ncbi:MAG: hypothetical protein KAI66_02095 [Lentisphaeria bacterium]|nr:hypothetical protein [Lentisphaeria bacterium]